MLNSAITQNTGITIDDFELLEGRLTQVHSLVNFLFMNDNHQQMPKQIFLNLLALASARVTKGLDNSRAIAICEQPDEPLKIIPHLNQAKSLLDAILISDGVTNTSLNDQGNLLWLVSDCLEEAKIELDCLPIIKRG